MMLQKGYKLSVTNRRFFRVLQYLSASILVFFVAVSGKSQTPSAASPTPAPGPSPANSPVKAESLRRWVEFDTLSVSTRYHFIENTNRKKAANNDQYQIQIKGRFKFDVKGDYSLTASFCTGNTFISGWNNTGWGTGARQLKLYVKQLYFQARPVKGVEFQVGAIPLLYGQSTEATAYDNDGYITGERLSFKYPKKLFFDQIDVTYAFLGDLNQPSAFLRFKRLNESNYHQFLAERHIGKRAIFSVDYTFQSGIDTLRQAIRVKVPETRVLDSVVYENYQVVGNHPGYGFNAFGEKKLNKTFSLSGGFTHIDRKMLNGDRFPQGNRIYFTGVAKLGHDLSLSVPFTQMLGSSKDVRIRTRVDVVLTFNLLDLLHSKRIL